MRTAQNISNGEKAETGREVRRQVHEILKILLRENLIAEYEVEINHSHRDFGYEKQFKCDYVVKTLDNKFILIRASNSYRSDRSKIYFYDFLGIQQFSNFSGEIVASIFLVPDGEESNSQYVSTRKKIEDGTFYSPASHWLTFTELTEFFNNYGSEVEDSLNTTSIAIDATESIAIGDYSTIFINDLEFVSEESGSYFGKSGNDFERFIAVSLNNSENLKAYKSGKKTCYEYDVILDSVIRYLQIHRSDILFLTATDTITRLKNGGGPKTDIHLKLFISQEKYFSINISVKNTTSTRVSCHDYQNKDFSRVIAPHDERFKLIVDTFQKAGSWKEYESLSKTSNFDFDTDEVLNTYMPEIINWAITGRSEKDYLNSPDTQVANFLFTRNASTGACKMEPTETYMSKLVGYIGTRRGAPFSWTYPSKRRGQRIQLKMPIELP